MQCGVAMVHRCNDGNKYDDSSMPRVVKQGGFVVRWCVYSGGKEKKANRMRLMERQNKSSVMYSSNTRKVNVLCVQC